MTCTRVRSSSRRSPLRAEADGYDAIGATELQHDPFISLAVAARATSTIQLGSSIAVAFARNPMSVAESANDLQLLSNGRFTLGLGSQIKPHIERRFSMPWSQPAERMRDFVLAVRAIQHSWQTGEKLDYRGEFYQHTLMTPMFAPSPNPHGAPKIAVAAVGQRMTEVAGEVADGWLSHSFTTVRYLREVSLPALARGGRRRASGGFGRGERAVVRRGRPRSVRTGCRDPSHPQTDRVLRQHARLRECARAARLGWSAREAQRRLPPRRMGCDGRGDRRRHARRVRAVGTPAEVAAQLRERFTGLATRVAFAFSNPVDPGRRAEIVDALDAG